MQTLNGADDSPIRNLGWRVTFAGVGINLALGILYTWSVISKGAQKEWGWTATEASWPYSIACLVFSLIMVLAGRMQDRIGPRIVATIGGVLVGIGMVVASFTTVPVGYMIGFGLLAGAGIGFGYASATPPAVKWFPPAKTGMIAGIVVSGFGLASVYAAPLTMWLMNSFGLQRTFLALGLAFLVVVVGLAQLLKAPRRAPQLAGGARATTKTKGQEAFPLATDKEDFTPGEMLRTWQFYVLWFTYACGAGAGLMIISKLAKIADIQAGITLGFILVAALAIGNGAGRIVAGTLSDKLGRKATMFICFVLQAALILLLSKTTEGSFLANVVVLSVFSALIGANYGANLSLFPSITKDFYGLKNFGVNYGFVFTAWGFGGFLLALLAGMVYDGKIIASLAGSFNFAYYCSAALLVVAAVVTVFVKAPHHAVATVPASQPAPEAQANSSEG